MLRNKSEISTICLTPLTRLKLKSILGLLILQILSFVLMRKSTSMIMLNSDKKTSLNSEKHPWQVKTSIPMRNKLLKLAYRMFLLMEISAALSMVLVSLWAQWISSN